MAYLRGVVQRFARQGVTGTVFHEELARLEAAQKAARPSASKPAASGKAESKDVEKESEDDD